MSNFLKSFFSGKAENAEDEKAKNEKKNFEILKYDGLRAQRMGRAEYAIKCFTKALTLDKDFETMGYLSQLYVQTAELDKACEVLKEMTTIEPGIIDTFITLTNVCYMQEAYTEMKDYALKALEIDKDNATAYYLLAKAERGLKEELNAIANLTKALVLKEDFTEARLMRAEVLIDMCQYKEAEEDIEVILQQSSDEESALVLKGKISEATDKAADAEEIYRKVTILNPFNQQAYLALGKLYISQRNLSAAIDVLDEAIEINPDFAAAYHERGRAKLLNGNKEGSIEDMKKALELNPKEEEALNGQFNNQKEEFDNLLGFVH
ncbi:tetratricopeptide repeat protein [uncultured Bacteroides sp.]|uniref:tetratricopeptide repeat protein n=1 Tax=uncultured Bacteroides sp. TaxID=162156 RepID=UPI002AA9070D|nr:tetratricopeptide repeat protein [uncultured Bacteroides sp.]